jgi:effector-binding domain-containing protein
MPGDVAVETVEARLTAVVAETTTWEAFPTLWARLLDEVYEVVRPRPELSPSRGTGHLWQNVMLYKDDVPAVEVGVLVSGAFEAVGRVVPSALPAGRVATAVHRGDFAGLGRAHDAVHRYAAENGLELAGPRWEVYGHWSADPRDLETEVFYLLR